MFRVFLTIIFIFVFTLPLFAQVDTAWVRTYFSQGNSQAKAVAVDASGYVYVTGFSVDSTLKDYLTIKYEPDGDTAWVRRYNGPTDGDDEANDITVDNSGYVYVTGESCTDIATIKYTSDGDTVSGGWVKRYPGGWLADKANAITVDGSGNVYVTGRFYDIDTDYDYILIKYTSDGTQSWVRTYDDLELFDEARDIVIDGSGYIYITGRSDDSDTSSDFVTLKYNSSGTWQGTYKYTSSSESIREEAWAMAMDGSDNFYVTGRRYYNEDWNYVTIKYPQYGAGWTSIYDSGEDDKVFDITVDNSGNVYVTGESSSEYGTVKYDDDGDSVWVKRYKGVGSGGTGDKAQAIAVDDSGYIYVTGYSYGNATNETVYDFATIKYDPNGGEVWIRRHDNPEFFDDEAHDIVVDDDGNVYVTGWSNVGNTEYVTIKYTYSSTVCGDCNGDGNVSVSDVTYLINYLYKGGNPPTPIWKADVNCDHSVDGGDVTYLINRLFKGGHAPACCG